MNIIHVSLEGGAPRGQSPQLDMERHKAVSDLLVENSFKLVEPANAQGPYRLLLSLTPDRLNMAVDCTQSGQTAHIAVSLSPLRGTLRDYVIICDNFYKIAQEGDHNRLEAVDMGRRGIHNDGAETLIEALENKVILDKLTARRLFSLLYVLHMRAAPTL